MYELSLNIMDIAQNSIRANAGLVSIDVTVNEAGDMLEIVIADDGDGMSEEVLRAVSDPFFTTRTTRKIGLGIPYYEMVAKMCGGEFDLSSSPGAGARVSASFRLSHIDRAPLGDMGQTVALLAGANPQIDFVYTLTRKNAAADTGAQTAAADPGAQAAAAGCADAKFAFDTREIKELLGDIGIDSPEIVVYMQSYINENSEIITGGIAL